MFRLILFVIFICLLSYTDNNQKFNESSFSKDTSLKIITTGIPDLEEITQLNTLAEKYGFNYYARGCVVTKSLGDSIKRVNDSTHKILNDRFGKHWRMNFYMQYDTINQIRRQADSVMQLRFPHEDQYFYYLVKQQSDKRFYNVQLYSMDSLDGKSELLVHYKILYQTDVK